MSLLYAALPDGGGRISIDEYDAPTHRGRISCPVCDAALTARRGALRVHHFAHHAGAACTDTWRPELTAWRRAWLARWARERVERRVTVGGTHPHISQGECDDTTRVADVVTERGNVVLLQHSGIAVDALYEREDFFLAATGRLPAWVFDATAAPLEVELRGQDFVVARVPYASWACARGPAFLDTADGTFLIVAQNLARPDMVVARPVPFKTDAAVLPAPPTRAGALPLSLTACGRRVTASSFLATDRWREVSRHFRWDQFERTWALSDFAGALSDKYGHPASLWLPVAPFGAPATDPRATLRRDRPLFDLLRTCVDRKRGPLFLPTGPLPGPLEAVRARGVRDLTASIFANVVAWNERLPDVTNQWLGFFRSLGWMTEYVWMGGELWVRTSTEHDKTLKVFIHNRLDYDELERRCKMLLASGVKAPFAVVPPCPVSFGTSFHRGYEALFFGADGAWPFLGAVCFRKTHRTPLFDEDAPLGTATDSDDDYSAWFKWQEQIIYYPCEVVDDVSSWKLVRVRGLWVGVYNRGYWMHNKVFDGCSDDKPIGYSPDDNDVRLSRRVHEKWVSALDEV